MSSRLEAAALLIGGGAAGAACWYYWDTRRRKEALEAWARGKDTVRVALLPLECSDTFNAEMSVSTVTFFEGALEPSTPHILARFRAVLKANPWLAGRIVSGPQRGQLELLHPASADEIDEAMMNDLFAVSPPDVRLSMSQEYPELVRASLPAHVPPGNCLPDKQRRVTRLTLARCADDPARFGILLSISHTVADGFTYYRVLNMLGGEPVEALLSERMMDFDSKMQEAVGKAEWNYTFSPQCILNIVSGALFGRRARCYTHYLDADRLAAAKAAAKGDQGVPFVSTNDVVVSTWGKACGFRLMMMAINLRGRIEGVTGQHSGNYESLLWMDPEGYGRPSSLRKTLADGPPFLGHAQPLPGFWEGVTTPLGQTSNWASFSAPLEVPGCKELLHVAVNIPIDAIPFECLLVFRPSGKRLGVMIISKSHDRKHFLESMPLGEPVAPAIWGGDDVDVK